MRKTERAFAFKDSAELKNVPYGGVMAGCAVLSSYITATRNSRPDCENGATREYFQHCLNAVADLADWARDFIAREGITDIHLFNGRLMDNRALYDLAISRGLSFHSNEVVGGWRTRENFRRMVYEGGLPHNLQVNRAMAEKLWSHPKVGMDEKVSIGLDFYERRRHNQIAGDRVYTSGQTAGLLPEGFDRTKRNIVIFNSSEDEFVALGKDFDDYQMFPNQTAGIVYLLEHLPSEEFHVYVRVHPNLTRIKYDYVRELYELPKKFGNLTVIAPDSQVSTYALMDAAEKVVVFGSTAGAEATYSGKPVILVGPSFYRFLDVAHTPETPQAFVECVQTVGLCAKPVETALKYAYFILQRKRLAVDCRYVDLSVKPVRFLSRTYYITGYAKLFGSYILMKFVRALLFRLFWHSGRRSFGDHLFEEHVYDAG